MAPLEIHLELSVNHQQPLYFPLLCFSVIPTQNPTHLETSCHCRFQEVIDCETNHGTVGEFMFFDVRLFLRQRFVCSGVCKLSSSKACSLIRVCLLSPLQKGISGELDRRQPPSGHKVCPGPRRKTARVKLGVVRERIVKRDGRIQ